MDIDYIIPIIIGIMLITLSVCIIIIYRKYLDEQDQNFTYRSTLHRILGENSMLKQMLGLEPSGSPETSTPAAEDAATHKDTSATDDSEKPQTDKSTKYRPHLLATLRKLNCQPEIGEDNKVYFQYQGEHFSILQHNGFMRIWDLPFMHVNVLDTNLPLIIEIINSLNNNFGPAIVICDPDEKGMRHIMSRYDILFHPDISNPEVYLENVLSFFFSIKSNLKDELRQLEPAEKSEKDPTPAIYSYALTYQN